MSKNLILSSSEARHSKNCKCQCTSYSRCTICNRPNQTFPISSDSFSSIDNDIALYIISIISVIYNTFMRCKYL